MIKANIPGTKHYILSYCNQNIIDFLQQLSLVVKRWTALLINAIMAEIL